MFKRKLSIGACTLAMPLYFIVKNRNTIYKGSKLVREFYIKELIARSFMGFFLGIGVSIFFYGAGPLSKEDAINNERRSDGKASINGKEVEKTSLEYSVGQKKKYFSKTDYLPGKIREE